MPKKTSHVYAPKFEARFWHLLCLRPKIRPPPMFAATKWPLSPFALTCLRSKNGHNRAGAYYVEGLQDSIVLSTMHTCPWFPGYLDRLGSEASLHFHPNLPQGGSHHSAQRADESLGLTRHPPRLGLRKQSLAPGEGTINPEVPTGTDTRSVADGLRAGGWRPRGPPCWTLPTGSGNPRPESRMTGRVTGMGAASPHPLAAVLAHIRWMFGCESSAARRSSGPTRRRSESGNPTRPTIWRYLRREGRPDL